MASSTEFKMRTKKVNFEKKLWSQGHYLFFPVFLFFVLSSHLVITCSLRPVLQLLTSQPTCRSFVIGHCACYVSSYVHYTSV